MLPGLIDVTPSAGLQLGPLPIGFYGVGFVLATVVLILVSRSEARRRDVDPGLVSSAVVIVAVFALVGARLYHVIGEWDTYASDPFRAVLPPYAGLGLYGGIIGAAVGIWVFVRSRGVPLWRALDIVVPGTLFAQGIARWGNFFNQELYGPPTDLAWGLAIDCEHRIAQYACSAELPHHDMPVPGTAGFHPLFFYESVLTMTGGFVALYLSRRQGAGLRDGDLASFWMIWYGGVRVALESFRAGWNWTIAGIPTAMLVGIALIAAGVVSAFVRRRR